MQGLKKDKILWFLAHLFVSLHTMNKKIVACLCLLMVAGIEDVCVGVSNVQYNSRRNSYFVNMTIYGGQNQLGKSITFKVWDANRNVTYTPLELRTVVAGLQPLGGSDDELHARLRI